MAYIPAPGVAQVKVTYLIDAQTLQNVFHIAKAGEWSAAQLDALLTIFEDWLADEAAPTRGIEAVAKDIRAIDLTSEDGAYAARNLGVGIPGTNAGAIMPANVTIAVQLATDFRGRGKQGRIFHIGLTETQCVGNLIVAGVETVIEDAYNDLRVNIDTGAEGQLAVLHSVSHGVPLDPKTWTPVKTCIIGDLVLDSQVNRLPNHKRHKRPTV